MILLSARQVSEKVGYSYNYFIAVIQHSRGFPKPIKFNPNSRPKWNYEHITAYLNNAR